MPDYKYQGTSRSGGSVSGTMTASNKSELQSLLKRQQITATKITEKGKKFNMPQFGGSVKAKESRAEFSYVVCGSWFGPCTAHVNRNCLEQLRRQHFWFAYPDRFCRCHLRIKGLVRNSPGPLCSRNYRLEAPNLGHSDEENR